jgi:hypothetical protein
MTKAQLRAAVKQVTPYGILRLRHRRAAGEREWLTNRLATAAGGYAEDDYSVEGAVRFLVSRGLDEDAVRQGSMPEASLEFTGDALQGRLPADRPVNALHVGNFVGVSLSYLTVLLKRSHEDSLVVSIDPNATHRGIANPMSHVMALLKHFDLSSNSVVVWGYSLEQNLNDAAVSEPVARWQSEAACEQVLESLVRLCGQRFDMVLLDGNHEGAYPTREWALVRRLLADTGIVVFDDVTVGSWYGVVDAFERAAGDADGEYEAIAADGRVGVIQRRSR